MIRTETTPTPSSRGPGRAGFPASAARADCAGQTLLWALLILIAVAALALVLLLGEGEAPEDGGSRLVDDASVSTSKGQLPEPAEDRPTPEPEPPPRLSGRVKGRVVFADRRIVPGARIDALEGTGLAFSSVLPNLPSLGIHAVSDAQGWFTLEGVPATSALRLRLDGDAFSTKDFGPYLVSAGGELDVGDLIVEPGVMVRGITIDDHGSPVVGASIELHYDPTSGDWGWDRSIAARVVLSDDEGRFQLPNVRRSGYVLRATAEGHASGLSKNVLLPGSTESEVYETLTLGTPGIIRGEVVAIPDDRPLVGARVVATPGPEVLGADTAETVTDANGQYVLDTLRPGRYSVQAGATGYKRQGKWIETGNEPRQGRLRLPANGSVSGYVLGRDGEPARYFDVQLLSHQNDFSEGYKLGNFRRFQTKDGRFRIDDLKRGYYSLEIWAKDFAVTHSETFLLTQGEQLEGLLVELEQGAILAGRVLDTAGQAVADAGVSMHFNQESSVDWLRGSFGPQAWLRSASTDADGRFELTGLMEGTFQIEVSHPDYSIFRENDIVVLKGVRNDLSQPFVLTPGGSLSGAALDRNGLAKPGVEVRLNGPGGLFLRMRTDGKGQFSFTRLPPGKYRLSAVPDRQATLDEALSSEAGRTNNPSLGTIQLGPGEHRRENAPLLW